MSLFTTIGSNVAIWLANLPLLIRVQTTLLTSTCHDLGHALKESFIWRRYCGKKQIVSGLDIRQDTGQNLLRTHSAALREHNILTTVMTNIVVDKNEDHTKALTIC